jgi:hypothetical protein
MKANTSESEYLLNTAVSPLDSNSAFLLDFSGLGPNGDLVDLFLEAFIWFAPAVFR